MKRRDVITMLGGAAAWPVLAGAQQRERVRHIGVLMTNFEHDPQGQARAAAFRRGLHELGWLEGGNLQIHWRWSGGDVARIREYTAELVQLAPDLLIANGTPVLAALKQATSSIPIVFVVVNDPVAQGFVSSVARPGGNITGFSFLDYSVVEKSLELLTQAASDVTRIAVLFNPQTYPYYNVFLRSFEATARSLGVEVHSAPVRAPEDIEQTVANLAGHAKSGLIVPPDPFTIVRRAVVIAATRDHRLPAIYFFRQFVAEGALMSYGANTDEIFRRSGAYVDRILKGAAPGDLPVQAPTKYELVINLKTARALGLDIPPTLLARADEVIE